MSVGAAFGLTAVLLGAFAAHGLKDVSLSIEFGELANGCDLSNDSRTRAVGHWVLVTPRRTEPAEGGGCFVRHRCTGL